MNHKTKKKFGQNFLMDKNILDKIILLSKPNKKNIIEIGPGTGNLTKYILKEEPKKLLAFEIDEDLIPLLKDEFSSSKNFKLISSDFLKVNLEEIIEEEFFGENVDVIANLPYYISSRIIFKLLENPQVNSIGIMLQKELVERIVSKPSTKAYGRFSVALNSFYEIEDYFIVSRNVFNPVPKVDSAFIKLNKRKVFPKDIKNYLEFIKLSFAQKRKTFLNSLKTNELFYNITYKYLVKQNYDLKIRAESLSYKEFINIYEEIEKEKNA